MTVQQIAARELFDLISSGKSIKLIDVRTPVEYREVHVECAKNIPLHELKPADLLNDSNAQQTIYVICKAGGRGRQACEKLIAAGCNTVINVVGGTDAWDQAGFPVVRGKKAISLERQVRIAAGSLLLVGTSLAIFVNPWLVVLNGLIGAGLVFAGVTDFCGMGLLLAKMPWNKVTQPSQSDSSSAQCSTRSAA